MTLVNNNVLDIVSEVLISNGFEKGMAEAVQLILNNAMRVERETYIGAKPYERNGQRKTSGNGFKSKTLKTRLGEIDVAVPQTRDSGFYPCSLEKGLRSERALRLALSEMYIQGVSTRKVMEITKKLCGFEVSASQVSTLSKDLDEQLKQWREKPLGAFSYLFLDARYEKVRYGGQVVDLAVLIAIGIEKSGRRSVLGVSVALSEAEPHWKDFLMSLTKRGLHGLEYIVSDDHVGLGAARKAVFPGVLWQRCQFHLAQNAQTQVSRKMNKEVIGQEIRQIFHAPTKATANQMLGDFIERYQSLEPRLAKWAEENIPEGFAVYALDVPDTVRKKLRTSNLCERINQEIARRSNLIRVFPNESSCLRIVSAILMEIDEEWLSSKRYFLEA